jgi:thioredoxin-dependent peroxiredoxin
MAANKKAKTKKSAKKSAPPVAKKRVAAKAVKPASKSVSVAKKSQPKAAVKKPAAKTAGAGNGAVKKPVTQPKPLAKKATSTPKRAQPAAAKERTVGAAAVAKPERSKTKAVAVKSPSATKGATASPAAPAQLSLVGVLPQPTGEAALGVGDALPDFVLLDQHGARVNADELRGSTTVLYFYPKDDTPGCTTQACGFRDEAEMFAGASVRVVGVSPDKPGTHARFATKYDLNFTLLADVDRVLCQAFGVWKLKKNYGRDYFGVERSTFLIGPEGKIRRVWRGVRVAGHVAEVLEAAKAI